MVTKWNKLYDPEAYSTAYKVFILSNATTLTFDFSKYCYDLDPWPLTLKNNRILPLIMVIKYTKLYDSRAYGSVSILPTRFFY